MAQLAEKQDLFTGFRGRVLADAPLGEAGWFKCGGRAEYLVKPEDEEDLACLLAALPADMPVQAFGALSNTIIRDGGLPGVTIRMGRPFGNIARAGDEGVEAGAFALDASVAKFAAESALGGLTFFSGIPGTVGGALRMNAGCYGTETKDVLVAARAYDRQGSLHVLTPAQMDMRYRHTATDSYIFASAVFRGVPGDRAEIEAAMAAIRERRESSQPIGEKTGGSTFANPSAEDIARAGLPPETKVWQLIEGAGGRGLRVGGAIMSEKHCNFMINTGGATAADLETLGEEVRRRVHDKYGIALRWEIKRLGEGVAE